MHLDVRVCGGGDGFRVVEYSLEQYRRRSRDYGPYSAGLILLDADRIEEDRRHGRDPSTALDGENLLVTCLQPNIEGLLYRLHPDCESRFVSAQQATQLLRTVWPKYVKPPTADALGRRFGLGDLRRASRHDKYLRSAVELLGL